MESQINFNAKSFLQSFLIVLDSLNAQESAIIDRVFSKFMEKSRHNEHILCLETTAPKESIGEDHHIPCLKTIEEAVFHPQEVQANTCKLLELPLIPSADTTTIKREIILPPVVVSHQQPARQETLVEVEVVFESDTHISTSASVLEPVSISFLNKPGSSGPNVLLNIPSCQETHSLPNTIDTASTASDKETTFIKERQHTCHQETCITLKPDWMTLDEMDPNTRALFEFGIVSDSRRIFRPRKPITVLRRTGVWTSCLSPR
ncbi:hypothetical protein BDR26DRAFT_848621 [Obelidium mucronatum]|nr:hypothetical protein BDR26DRAFT_848621 [Obelidium mucronatum]